jgi:hypothetical protein
MQVRHDAGEGWMSGSALAERGWTVAAIRRFLGEPDRTVPNPAFRTAGPMRLFRLERVVAAEQTEPWQRWRERFVQRSARSRAVAATKRAELLADIAALDIRVPVMSMETLTGLAVAHRNEVVRSRPGPRARPVTAAETDAATLRRWMVGYLRHRTTVHNATLDRMYARVGRAEATVAIRNTVFAVIATTYPALADETRRQVARGMST